jgi:hypothetical protein
MKTLLSEIIFTKRTVLQLLDANGVFRVIIEKEFPHSPEPSVFVAYKTNSSFEKAFRWAVKKMPLSEVKKHWDDIIDVAIDAVRRSGTIVTKHDIISRVVPGDKELMSFYDAAINTPPKVRKHIPLKKELV